MEAQGAPQRLPHLAVRAALHSVPRQILRHRARGRRAGLRPCTQKSILILRLSYVLERYIAQGPRHQIPEERLAQESGRGVAQADPQENWKNFIDCTGLVDRVPQGQLELQTTQSCILRS